MAARRKARRSSKRRSRKASRKSRKRVVRKRRVKRRPVARRRKARKPSVRGSKVQVFRGTRTKTKTSGQMKKDLMKNSRGKIVSKLKHKSGKKCYKNIKNWTAAFMEAREKLGITGFVACKKGTQFYKECMRIYKQN